MALALHVLHSPCTQYHRFSYCRSAHKQTICARRSRDTPWWLMGWEVCFSCPVREYVLCVQLAGSCPSQWLDVPRLISCSSSSSSSSCCFSCLISVCKCSRVISHTAAVTHNVERYWTSKTYKHTVCGNCNHPLSIKQPRSITTV